MLDGYKEVEVDLEVLWCYRRGEEWWTDIRFSVDHYSEWIE